METPRTGFHMTRLISFQVNELAGACHTCRSLHYQGRAVDIDPAKSKAKTQSMIDLCFDMQGFGVNETNHIHCEFAKF